MEVYLAKIDSIDKTTSSMNQTMVAYMQKVDGIVSQISDAATEVATNQRFVNQMILVNVVLLALILIGVYSIILCPRLSRGTRASRADNTSDESSHLPRCFTIM